MSKRKYWGRYINPNKKKKRFRKRDEKSNLLLAKSRAYDLIQKATDSEIRLKTALEQKNIHFYFQFPHSYKGKIAIVDFAFPRANKETRLYVEIDGGYHLTDKQKAKDSQRSQWLNEHTGAEIIRFTNEQVLNDLEYVMEKIISKRVQFMT